MESNNIEPYNDDETHQLFLKEDAYIRAKKKLDKIVGFYWHLAIYVIVNIFLILLIGFKSGEGFFSFAPYSTAIFWGIGLMFHFLGVFGPNFMFGKNWEQKKIKELMDKDSEEFKRFE
jgi:hypothetical protein